MSVRTRFALAATVFSCLSLMGCYPTPYESYEWELARARARAQTDLEVRQYLTREQMLYAQQAQERAAAYRTAKQASDQEARARWAEARQAEFQRIRGLQAAPPPLVVNDEDRARTRLRQALTFLELGQPEDARAYCEQVVARYAGTAAAEDARQLLVRLKR